MSSGSLSNRSAAPELQTQGLLRRPAGLSHQLVERLGAQIREGGIAPGGKLPTEAQIIREHGVSRTVVREALSRLSATGVVHTRHGIGTFVSETAAVGNFSIEPLELATLLEVMAVLELRISLESEAAGLAAQHRSATQLKLLQKTLREFTRSVASGGETVKPDFDFHLQVAVCTGNRYFAHLMEYLGTMIIPRTRLNTAQLAREDRAAYLGRVGAEHATICEAIAARDAPAARDAMRLHLSNSRDRLRRAQTRAGQVRAI